MTAGILKVAAVCVLFFTFLGMYIQLDRINDTVTKLESKLAGVESSLKDGSNKVSAIDPKLEALKEIVVNLRQELYTLRERLTPLKTPK